MKAQYESSLKGALNIRVQLSNMVPNEKWESDPTK